MSRFKLKNILIVSCILLVLLSTLFISVLTYQQFSHILTDQFAQSRVDVLRQISERITGTNNCLTVLSNLYYSNLPTEALAKEGADFTEQDQKETVQLLHHLDTLSEDTIIAAGISCHYVLALKNGFSYCSQGYSDSHCLEAYESKLWYADIVRAKGENVWISTYASFTPSQTKHYVYSLAKSILDPRTGESIGIFLFNVDAPSLAETYGSNLVNNTIYVTDAKGTIVSHSNEDMLGIHFFHMGRLNALLDGRNYTTIDKNQVPYLLSSFTNTAYKWMIVEEIPMAEVLRPMEHILRSTAILDAAVLLATIGIISLIAIYATRPLHQLCDQLARVGKSASTERFTIKGCQEIREINEECNSMLTRIEGLIQDVTQKETSRRKLELSLLQAQINPHFVYNTLFTIKCLIDMEDKEKAMGLVDRFTAIMRSALSVSDSYTSIQDEINLLQQYCELQKYRYGDIFEVNITCAPSLYPCKLLRMLVQPLVENAIFHGISCSGRRGQIDLKFYREREDLYVTVRDNGVGIAPGELENILSGNSVRKDQRSNFIGIRNITDRIRLYFGDGYGLTVRSRPGEGTEITLHLPLLCE